MARGWLDPGCWSWLIILARKFVGRYLPLIIISLTGHADWTFIYIASILIIILAISLAGGCRYDYPVDTDTEHFIIISMRNSYMGFAISHTISEMQLNCSKKASEKKNYNKRRIDLNFYAYIVH